MRDNFLGIRLSRKYPSTLSILALRWLIQCSRFKAYLAQRAYGYSCKESVPWIYHQPFIADFGIVGPTDPLPQ